MKKLNLAIHLFLPHESNNHKAKILHPSGLLSIACLLVFYQLLLNLTSLSGARILGYAANISPDEVVRLTNEKRVQNGFPPLEINQNLVSAALAKGTDMISKDYWAHVAPDGTQPWKFFGDVGYKYKYAGENLARDFSNPGSAVEAWMNSPSHKENMLSPKYREIGIAVVEGDLAGVDTTIIVQFFGTKLIDTIPAVPVAAAQQKLAPVSTPAPTPQVLATPQRVLISPFNTTKGLSLTVVAVLLLVLILDGIITTRRAIVRIGGRTFAHLAFLGMILSIILILKAGRVI